MSADVDVTTGNRRHFVSSKPGSADEHLTGVSTRTIETAREPLRKNENLNAIRISPVARPGLEPGHHDFKKRPWVTLAGQAVAGVIGRRSSCRRRVKPPGPRRRSDTSEFRAWTAHPTCGGPAKPMRMTIDWMSQLPSRHVDVSLKLPRS
jgi:hypothetical protein